MLSVGKPPTCSSALRRITKFVPQQKIASRASFPSQIGPKNNACWDHAALAKEFVLALAQQLGRLYVCDRGRVESSERGFEKVRIGDVIAVEDCDQRRGRSVQGVVEVPGLCAVIRRAGKVVTSEACRGPLHLGSPPVIEEPDLDNRSGSASAASTVGSTMSIGSLYVGMNTSTCTPGWSGSVETGDPRWCNVHQ